MKKFLLLGLAALALWVVPSTRADERTTYVKHIETCEAILQEFMDDPNYAIPPQVLQRAHGIVILNQFKASFIFGATGGYGVILVKRPDGSWSIPVMINGGGVSFGLQAGGKAIESIFILTDDDTARRLFDGQFNIGVDAKAVAGPRWMELESVNKEIFATPVLVYTKSKGLFAGATIKAGYIARDDDSNRRFYQTPYTMPELLYSNFVTPPNEVKPLMAYVTKITAGGTQ
ncbi:MAG TPA: lipid-binding SYLF domain-containing protein [Opitutaceae bacterium]|nr:lipid-binding SYLF domain-containing protein [Opitutaceae bacterium]